MFDFIGRHLSSQFIDNPIFIIGGSRSGTIALLKALGKHKNILAAPTEDPFMTDIGRMALNLDFFSNHEKQYYLRTLRISFDYIANALRRLALESAFGSHYGVRQYIRQVINDRINIFNKFHW